MKFKVKISVDVEIPLPKSEITAQKMTSSTINQIMRSIKSVIQPYFPKQIQVRWRDDRDGYNCPECPHFSETRKGMISHWNRNPDCPHAISFRNLQKETELYISSHIISEVLYIYLENKIGNKWDSQRILRVPLKKGVKHNE